MSAVLGPALTTAASLTLVMMEGGFCWSVAVPAWASVAAWARAGAVGEHGLASCTPHWGTRTSILHWQPPQQCSLAPSGQRGVSPSQLSQQTAAHLPWKYEIISFGFRQHFLELPPTKVFGWDTNHSTPNISPDQTRAPPHRLFRDSFGAAFILFYWTSPSPAPEPIMAV